MTKSKDSAPTPSDKSPDDDPWWDNWWDNWWAQHGGEVAARGLHDMTVQSLLSHEFLRDEERGVEAALVFLLEHLRIAKSPELEGVVTVSDVIADMLDPDKSGRWKLELRRNVPGSPSLHHGGFYNLVAFKYFEQLNTLKDGGARSPAKEARRRLLKLEGWSDNDIRRALRWARKRGWRFKPLPFKP
jgi:hypothetical protein